MGVLDKWLESTESGVVDGVGHDHSQSQCVGRAQESPQGHSKWGAMADLVSQPWCNNSSSDCLGSPKPDQWDSKIYLPNDFCVKEELKSQTETSKVLNSRHKTEGTSQNSAEPRTEHAHSQVDEALKENRSGALQH